MLATEVRDLLTQIENTRVKQVYSEIGQDPFVLYENIYSLSTKIFVNLKDVQDFFRGKLVAVRDSKDESVIGPWKVEYWIHTHKVREQ